MKNNTKNGYGEFENNGKRFLGYYLNDYEHGFGIYHWKSSNCFFVGFWKNGKRDGVAKILNSDKRNKYSYWKNGQKTKTFKDESEAHEYLTKKEIIYYNIFTFTHQELCKFIN